MPSSTFLSTAHGDLTIEWDDANTAAMIEHIQAMMDRGITFFKLEEQGKTRKKTVAVPLGTTAEVSGNKVLIKDADIAQIVDAGLATIARYAGVGDIKTVGTAKTAAEAAATDTIARQPAKGG